MDEKLDIIAIGESLVELSTNAKMSEASCLYKSYGEMFWLRLLRL